MVAWEGGALMGTGDQATCLAFRHVLYQVVHLPVVDPRAGGGVGLVGVVAGGILAAA